MPVLLWDPAGRLVPALLVRTHTHARTSTRACVCTCPVHVALCIVCPRGYQPEARPGALLRTSCSEAVLSVPVREVFQDKAVQQGMNTLTSCRAGLGGEKTLQMLLRDAPDKAHGPQACLTSELTCQNLKLTGIQRGKVEDEKYRSSTA